MALFDNTFLCLLFHPAARPPNGSDGKPISRCKDRIDQLVSQLEAQHTKIVIPTPALTELLVLAGPNSAQYVNEINSRSCFKVADFDQRAAIEAALMMAAAISAGDKRAGTGSPYQKVKFDRQIVAIAKVWNIKTLYSDDGDVKQYAEESGITVVRVEELPLPPPTQMTLQEIANPQAAAAPPQSPGAQGQTVSGVAAAAAQPAKDGTETKKEG